MRSNIVKISILTSLATALIVSVAMLHAGPRLDSNSHVNNPNGTLQTPAETVQNPGMPYNGGPGSHVAYSAPRQGIYYDANGNQVVYPPVAYSAPAPVVYPANPPASDPVTRRRVYYDENGNVVRTSSGEPVVYRHHRSKKKSALIIGGAAATGAAIGALAHGGKGAAIGALAGGAGGLAYDRLTVNK